MPPLSASFRYSLEITGAEMPYFLANLGLPHGHDLPGTDTTYTRGGKPSWLPNGATGNRPRGVAWLLVKVSITGDPYFMTSPLSHPTDKEVEVNGG